MKMVKYKVNQDFLKEIKELYQQDDAFDIFEHVYCNHFENEKKKRRKKKIIHLQKSYTTVSLSAKEFDDRLF